MYYVYLAQTINATYYHPCRIIITFFIFAKSYDSFKLVPCTFKTEFQLKVIQYKNNVG